MSNALAIIEPALAGRTANDPELNTDAELIAELSRELKQLYTLAYGLNPWFFSKHQQITPDGVGWPYPADALGVLRIWGEGPAGSGADAVLTATGPLEARVAQVNLNDRQAEFSPRVYRLGSANQYTSVGESEDPSHSVNGDLLAVIYAFVHPDLDTSLPLTPATNNVFDTATYRSKYDALLICRMKRYLAIKDGRSADLADIEADLERYQSAFNAEVQGSVLDSVRRWSRTA